MATLPPVPRGNPLIKGLKDWAVNLRWDQWFQRIVDLFARSPEVVGSVSLSAQSASVSATTLNMGTLAAGLYRATYSADITQAAAVSSSLVVAFGWTYNGVARTFTGSTITNGTTAEYQSAVVPMRVDASSNVTYTVTRASSGSPAMQYGFIAALESVPT